MEELLERRDWNPAVRRWFENARARAGLQVGLPDSCVRGKGAPVPLRPLRARARGGQSPKRPVHPARHLGPGKTSNLLLTSSSVCVPRFRRRSASQVFLAAQGVRRCRSAKRTGRFERAPAHFDSNSQPQAKPRSLPTRPRRPPRPPQPSQTYKPRIRPPRDAPAPPEPPNQT